MNLMVDFSFNIIIEIEIYMYILIVPYVHQLYNYRLSLCGNKTLRKIIVFCIHVQLCDSILSPSTADLPGG